MGLVTGLGVMVLFIAICSIVTSGLIVKKHEQFLINLSLKNTFSLTSCYIARRLFLVILSTIVSFASLNITSNTLLGVQLLEITNQEALMTLFVQLIFGLLVLLYDMDTLLDRRAGKYGRH